MSSDVRIDVQNTISRFMNSFDLKDWAAMRTALADDVYVDYSDLRGDPPQTVRADDYVTERISALEMLQTQHLIANFDVEVAGDRADANASCVIFRRNESAVFTTHAQYQFGLVERDFVWFIVSIRQRVLWNDGDPSLHAGIRPGVRRR